MMIETINILQTDQMLSKLPILAKLYFSIDKRVWKL